MDGATTREKVQMLTATIRKRCIPRCLASEFGLVENWAIISYIKFTSGAKTIKKNTNSTQNKIQTHRAKQYDVTSFLSTDCELSTETCPKNVYTLKYKFQLQLHLHNVILNYNYTMFISITITDQFFSRKLHLYLWIFLLIDLGCFPDIWYHIMCGTRNHRKQGYSIILVQNAHVNFLFFFT